jgi:HEAT repeats/HEAT-like repeat
VLTRAGRLEQARFIFEKMLTYANHLGLYAEETGPSGEALGNFPQAFTHMGLISAASTWTVGWRARPEGPRRERMFGRPSYLGVATADWVAALKSSDPLERRLAAHALAEIGRTAREAVPALTEALRDSVSFVRVWAAAALARIEPENPDAILALVAGTCDGIYFVRSLAAWHLGRLGPRHPGIEAAVPELGKLLNDNDPSVRAEALVALGNLAGKGAPPAELKSLSAHG